MCHVAITKSGNGLARRMLVEAVWTYRLPARASTPAVPPTGSLHGVGTKVMSASLLKLSTPQGECQEFRVRPVG
jgi:hypothetical protein